MKRVQKLTSDGSYTMYVPLLNEHFHSIHGAKTESEHIFIKHGLLNIDENILELNILEFGLGTGLNLLLTLQSSNSDDRHVFYHAIEQFPILKGEFPIDNLLFSEFSTTDIENLLYQHWGETIKVCGSFSVFKNKIDMLQFVPMKKYHLVYFDAFAPDVQPELWTVDFFQKIYNAMEIGGILVTYCAKGQFKRDLKEVGFVIESLPGPPGKREITRARKSFP